MVFDQYPLYDYIKSHWPLYKIRGGDFGHSHLCWAKPCSNISAMFGQAFRPAAEQRDMVLLWLKFKTRPSPTDSSSTNRLEYAHSGCQGNKKKQEVVMMSLCFGLFPHVDVNHWALFSVKIWDVLRRACPWRVHTNTKKRMRQTGSLWLVPWSRQSHWDYNYLHNSEATPAISIWHFHLSMAFNSQTGSFLEQADVTLSVKNMGFKVKGQTNVLTYIPT